jgi:hypothetical protein
MTTTGRSDVGAAARRQKHNPLTRTKPLRRHTKQRSTTRPRACRRWIDDAAARLYGRLEPAPGVGRSPTMPRSCR